MGLQVRDLSSDCRFGAVVEGLDVSALASAELRRELMDLWIDRGVLVFHGLDGSAATQVALSSVFGKNEIHSTKKLLGDDAPVLEDAHPELLQVKQTPDDGDIYDVDGEHLAGFLPWHKDLIYFDRINRGGLMRVLEVPRSGGKTGFMDQIELYATLPEDLKQRIEHLDGIYSANFNAATKKYGRRPGLVRQNTMLRSVQENLHRFERVVHPLVFAQPETGRKVLNVSPWFLVAIEGLDERESDELAERLVDHCERGTATYFHEWHRGDMVLFDNWRTLHCASGQAVDDRRWLQRTTIAGDYALGRSLSGDALGNHQKIGI